MKHRYFLFLLLPLLLAQVGCQAIAQLSPTATPLPTNTPLPTATAVPTQTPSPEPTATFTPLPTATSVPATSTVAASGATGQNQPVAKLDLTVRMPEGWFYKEQEVANTIAFFVTKEDIAVHDRFSTGLTVNVVTNLPDALEQSIQLGQGLADLETQVQLFDAQSWTTPNEVMVQHHIDMLVDVPVDARDPVKAPIKHLRYDVIADLENDIMYLILFETPEATWAEEWDLHGKAIIEDLLMQIWGADYSHEMLK